jgi:hypothetical protein
MFLPEEYAFYQKDYAGHTRLIRMNSIYFMIEDNPYAHYVRIFIKGFVKPLTLWKNEEYFLIGDYTQKQVEDRILELLSPDIKRSLWNLSAFLPYED